jgi:acyl-coenzyme A thioesterase PaaI-like protein
MAPTASVMNAVNAVHAGAISTVLEIAAYLALLPDLSDDEEAVSHGLSISYIGRAEGDEALVANGRVLRRTRRLAFVTAELRQGERLLATAQVTKSVYPIPAGD